MAPLSLSLLLLWLLLWLMTSISTTHRSTLALTLPFLTLFLEPPTATIVCCRRTDGLVVVVAGMEALGP